MPLRFAAAGPPVGAFEIYLSYRPIAAAIAHDKRLIVLVVGDRPGAAVGGAVPDRRAGLAAGCAARRARTTCSRATTRSPGCPTARCFANASRRLCGAAGDGPRRRRRAADRPRRLHADQQHARQPDRRRGAARDRPGACRQQLGGDTLVARIGADEYAILCPHAEGVTGALRTAAHVHDAMEPPIELRGDRDQRRHEHRRRRAGRRARGARRAAAPRRHRARPREGDAQPRRGLLPRITTASTPPACCCSARCARRSTATSSSCTTSRRSTCERAGDAAWRRCCAGATPSTAC